MARVTPEDQLETLKMVLVSAMIHTWDVAIDGGANIGDWTLLMAERFGKVIAFEPSYISEILFDRTQHLSNVEVRVEALLDRHTKVRMIDPRKHGGKSTSLYVGEDLKGEISAVTVDGFYLQSCGLIKLDLEGAELPAIIGARETIKRCHPVLIVEFERQFSRRFGREQVEVNDHILSLGYQLALERGSDRVFVPIGR